MLNKAQEEVCKHREGAILVIAGAGTGKTRTLIHRYVSLIESGIRPERILLLTFTRKAAHEMQERASTLLQNRGIPADLHQTAGTFHSVAFRWLRKLEIMNSGFSIVDEKDLKKLIKLDLSKDEKQILTLCSVPLGNILQMRSLMINLQLPLRDIVSRFFSGAYSCLELIEIVLQRLEKRKVSSEMFDYDDILLKWLETLKSEEGDIIRGAYDHVMVDEYQDTSFIQVAILKELAKEHQNIMAVGDDCQSIYSFRGALADQMMEFTKDFEDSKIVKLEDNYRSGQAILDMCNDVIAPSKDVYPKTLQSANRINGPEPKLITAYDDNDVARRIIETVFDNLNSGIPLNEQAILFRSTIQVQTLERMLVREKIPYKKFGGVKITEAAHLKDFMSIISCCFCKNTSAWMRVLEMVPGIGPVKAIRIIENSDNGRIDIPNIQEESRERITELFTLVNSEPEDKPQESFIDACLKWYKPYLFDHYENAGQRLFEIENLCGELLHCESLNDFAAEILLDRVELEQDEYDSSLILSTIHSAKGKEWNCVYIVNVADGAIPLKRMSADYEEERRLLYVAMTRSRERLYLYYPKNSGFESAPPPLSPFLKLVEKKEYSQIPVETTPNDEEDPDDLIYVYDDSGIF